MWTDWLDPSGVKIGQLRLVTDELPRLVLRAWSLSDRFTIADGSVLWGVYAQGAPPPTWLKERDPGDPSLARERPDELPLAMGTATDYAGAREAAESAAFQWCAAQGRPLKPRPEVPR